MKNLNHVVDVAGVTLPVTLRRHRASRNIIVRYHPATDSVSLTLPKRAPVAQGLEFLRERASWLAQQRHPFLQPIVIVEGVELPILGRVLRVERTGALRGVVECNENILRVPGAPEHLNRRLQDHLTGVMRQYCRAAAVEKASMMGAKLGAVSIRDTHSRWGSCNSDGDLSFAWRLVFAPPMVLHYVIGHEVAHLVHMNHSPAFWRVVEQLCPHWQEARQWLRREGQILYRYRF